MDTIDLHLGDDSDDGLLDEDDSPTYEPHSPDAAPLSMPNLLSVEAPSKKPEDGETSAEPLCSKDPEPERIPTKTTDFKPRPSRLVPRWSAQPSMPVKRPRSPHRPRSPARRIESVAKRSRSPPPRLESVAKRSRSPPARRLESVVKRSRSPPARRLESVAKKSKSPPARRMEPADKRSKSPPARQSTVADKQSIRPPHRSRESTKQRSRVPHHINFVPASSQRSRSPHGVEPAKHSDKSPPQQHSDKSPPATQQRSEKSPPARVEHAARRVEPATRQRSKSPAAQHSDKSPQQHSDKSPAATRVEPPVSKPVPKPVDNPSLPTAEQMCSRKPTRPVQLNKKIAAVSWTANQRSIIVAPTTSVTGKFQDVTHHTRVGVFASSRLGGYTLSVGARSISRDLASQGRIQHLLTADVETLCVGRIVATDFPSMRVARSCLPDENVLTSVVAVNIAEDEWPPCPQCGLYRDCHRWRACHVARAVLESGGHLVPHFNTPKK